MDKNELAALIKKHVAATIQLNALIAEFNANLEDDEPKINSAPNPFQCPDFASWKKKGIPSESLGRLIAPEDFYMYDENGEKRVCFTFHEAKEIEESILIPNGWRILERKEWIEITNEFNPFGHTDIERFLRTLNMDPDSAPDAIPNVRCNRTLGKCLMYWSGTECSGVCASAIHVPGVSVLNRRSETKMYGIVTVKTCGYRYAKNTPLRFRCAQV